MENRTTVNGLVILAAGLLAESASNLLEHLTILGSATDFTRGLLDGLAVVAFAVAIFILSRSLRTEKPRS
jgi:hypothetical protein